MRSTQPFCRNVAGQRRDHPKRKKNTSTTPEFSLAATALLCLACGASITSPVAAASLCDVCLISERNCNRHANRRQRRAAGERSLRRRINFRTNLTASTRAQNEPRIPRSWQELNERCARQLHEIFS